MRFSAEVWKACDSGIIRRESSPGELTLYGVCLFTLYVLGIVQDTNISQIRVQNHVPIIDPKTHLSLRI